MGGRSAEMWCRPSEEFTRGISGDFDWHPVWQGNGSPLWALQPWASGLRAMAPRCSSGRDLIHQPGQLLRVKRAEIDLQVLSWPAKPWNQAGAPAASPP